MNILHYWLHFNLCFLCICFAFAFDGDNHSVVSITTRVKDSESLDLGMIRYHYDPSKKKSACSTVLILGVGTAMSVSKYDKLSAQIAIETSVLVIISDHNEHHIRKDSPQRYARLANAINKQLPNLVPLCAKTPDNVMIGGHSSSGEASMKAIQNDLFDFQPQGFVGLDPFEISEDTFGSNSFIMNVPALNWGFTRTTCLVVREKAAAGAYNMTSKAARVLYAIGNDGRDCKITHCVFSDHGCGIAPFTCSTREEYEWVFQYVAKSIRLFVAAVSEGMTFSNEYFQLETDHEVLQYVNDDEIETWDHHEMTLLG